MKIFPKDFEFKKFLNEKTLNEKIRGTWGLAIIDRNNPG